MADTKPKIVCDPKILQGKPVIAGTRISVELILDKLGAGRSYSEILEAHPNVTQEGILAAVRFAAEALRDEVVYPIAG